MITKITISAFLRSFKVLITKGAERNGKTSNLWSTFPAGSTPLDIAEKTKHYDMAAFLKDSGFKRSEDMKQIKMSA